MQTTARILRYVQENGLKTVCLTDRFWDETVPGASSRYTPQDFAHISAALPLPQAEGVRFLFGCETELDRFLTLGVSKERFSAFDFIVIPTTYFHVRGYTLSEDELQNTETRVNARVKQLDAVLSMPLPFHKIGLVHLTCGLIAPMREEYRVVLQHLPAAEMERLFKKAATPGVGIELNADDMRYADSEADIVLRPYRIAKACGCRFYCGSDAHHPQQLDDAKRLFERAVDALALTEEDKFRV